MSDVARLIAFPPLGARLARRARRESINRLGDEIDNEAYTACDVASACGIARALCALRSIAQIVIFITKQKICRMA